MNIGAQLYTVREYTKTPQDIETTLQKVAAIGYKTVHVSAFGPIEPQHLRDLLDGAGLTCNVTHIPPARLLEDMDGVLKEHKTLGCDSIGMGMMPEQYRGSLDGLKAFLSDYHDAVRRIVDAGFSFHYHNHAIEFMRDGNCTFLEILLETWPEAKLLMCAYWVQVGGGDPIDWIHRFGDRMVHVHLKDMAHHFVDGKGEQMMTPVLSGNMNYRGIVRALAEHSSCQNMYVEQDHSYGADPFACLKESFDNLVALKAEGVF